MQRKNFYFVILNLFFTVTILQALNLYDLRSIYSTNPTPYELNQYILQKCQEKNVPPIIFKAILLKEGQSSYKWKQYSPDSGFNHETIVYGTDIDANGNIVSYGLGLFQVTYKIDQYGNFLDAYNHNEITSVVSNWKTNIDKAMDILLTKWQSNIGSSFQGADANPLIIENWYYAIAWYNGSGTYAKSYVDNVYAYMMDSERVKVALGSSADYNDILGYYRYIPSISLPYIIPTFVISYISASNPLPYTLREIVDNGGELHIWDKEDDIYFSYDLDSGTVSSDVSGIFDGAGSIVSPTQSCWGCDKDEVRMQAHSDLEYGSTVVFQWLYDEQNCNRLDLIASQDIEVEIKSKAWSDHLTTDAKKVTLGSQRVTIDKPTSDIPWTTFAITSTKPLLSMVSISAYCKNSTEASNYDNNMIDINTDLVDVTHDYYWTGTASIITQAISHRGSNQFGVDMDWAIAFDTKNSLTSFQWFTSNECKQLKISNVYGSDANINELKIKGWASKDWSDNLTMKLPYIIEAPSIGNYYIIKVKSNPSAFQSGAVEASCVE